METIIVVSIIAVIGYGAYKWFAKKRKAPKSGSGGGEGDNKPSDPNYPQQNS